MNEVNGRFYLKKTINGNLLGEFSNNHSNNDIITESADLLTPDLNNTNGSFLGEYHSTWQDRGTPHFARLTISFKPGCNRVFELEWEENGRITFRGEGMLCDNILIGDYRSVRP